MSLLRAVGIGLLLLLYLRSPIDLVPDRLGAIGLLDDLLVLLGVSWWLARAFRQAGTARGPRPQTPPPGQPGRWDPYAVLDVPFNATRQQITHAYHEQMKRYHPDRVADLGSELQRVAHEKTIEIQRAYEDLRAK